MKNSTALALVFALALAACSDDSRTPPTRNNDNNDNNVNNVVDMGEDQGTEEDAGQEDMAVEPGRLEISTTLLTFEGVRQEESETQSVVVTNVGGDDLVIVEATVAEVNTTGPSEFAPGEDWVNEATIIEPGTFVELDVLYTPTDFETDRGNLTIETTDPENPFFNVRIESTSAYRDVDAPSFFRFGFVEADTTETRPILVFNRGGEPLTLQNIEYAGMGLFSIDFSANTNFPDFPATDAILEPDEAFQIDVTYSPENTDPDRGTITITSNDPDEAAFDISVGGNQSGECIRATPRVVDFGELSAGTTSTQTIGIFNCSNMVDLDIATIEVTDDGGDVFSLVDPPMTPFTLDGFDSTSLEVSAQIEEGERVGSVTVTTGDGEPRVVELRAAVQP